MSVLEAWSVSDAEALRQARVNASGILARGGDPRLAAIVAGAAQRLSIPIAYCSILDGTREWLPAAVGIEPGERRRSECFYERDGDPALPFADWAPLKHPSGSMLGALCVIDDQPRAPLSDGETEALRDFAAALAAEICEEQAMQAYGSWAVDLLVEQIRDAAAIDREPLMIALDEVLREVERAIGPSRL